MKNTIAKISFCIVLLSSLTFTKAKAEGYSQLFFEFVSAKTGEVKSGCWCSQNIMPTHMTTKLWLPEVSKKYDLIQLYTLDSVYGNNFEKKEYAGVRITQGEIQTQQGEDGYINVDYSYACKKQQRKRFVMCGKMIISYDKSYNSEGVLIKTPVYSEDNPILLAASKYFTIVLKGDAVPGNANPINPVKAESKNTEAWGQLMEKNYKDAIETCNKGLEYCPGYLYLLGNLAHAYLMNGEYDKAIAIYKAHVGEYLVVNLSWSDAIEGDFKEFKSKGLGKTADFDKVLKELKLK